MEEHEKIELRTDEVQEILGTPPGWLVSWGTLAVFLGICGLLAAAWYINYPDLVEGRATISTVSPPVQVVSRAEGPIHRLFVKENDAIEQGAVLAVIQSTADHSSIIDLEKKVEQWQKLGTDSIVLIRPPKDLNLGEVQAEYSIFIQQLEDLRFLNSDKSAGSSERVARLREQIQNLNRTKGVNASIVEKAEQDLAHKYEDFKRAKELYAADLISLKQFRDERQKVADAERELEALKSNDIKSDMEINSIQKMIGEISVDNRQDASASIVRVREGLNTLRLALAEWKQKYLLTAPIAGKATLNAEIFSEQQYVKDGQTVLTIAPPEGQQLVARVGIGIAGSGKVKEGQRVLVQLQSYPYEEFGSVEGLVKSKSLVPNGEIYPVLVELPKGLETSRGHSLKFEQQLVGKALIVTENRRFLERFLDKIFARTEQM